MRIAVGRVNSPRRLCLGSVECWPLANTITKHRETPTGQCYPALPGTGLLLGPVSSTVPPRSRWACVADQALGNVEGKTGRRLGVTGPAQSVKPSPLGLDLAARP
jgi:hypothetical protein